MERFLLSLSVNVTGMFRDPDFSHLPKQSRAATTNLSVQHLACRMFNRREVYSIAILLQEEGFTIGAEYTPPT